PSLPYLISSYLRINQTIEKLGGGHYQIGHNIEQLPQGGQRRSTGDAPNVGAAFAQFQAHAVLRYILLCPQICDSPPHIGDIPLSVVHLITPSVGFILI